MYVISRIFQEAFSDFTKFWSHYVEINFKAGIYEITCNFKQFHENSHDFTIFQTYMVVPIWIPFRSNQTQIQSGKQRRVNKPILVFEIGGDNSLAILRVWWLSNWKSRKNKNCKNLEFFIQGDPNQNLKFVFGLDS